MKDEMEKFLKNKKNRRMILWLLGAIVLYFVLKKKDTVQEAEVGYSGARVGTGDYTGGKPTTIPPITVPVVVTGEYTPEFIYEMHPDDGQLVVSGSSRNWKISDNSTLTVPSDKEFLYIIGCQNIRTSTPIKNIAYQSNNDVLIEKWIVKKSTPALAYWWYADDNWGDRNGRSALAKSEAAFAQIHFRKVA